MKNPDAEIIIVSRSASLAVKFNRQARDCFNYWAPKLTNYQLSKKMQAANFWGVEGYKGSSFAVGVEGQIVGAGADYLLIDDYCKGKKEAMSSTQKEAIWEWFETEARTRLSPNGVIIVVATPWSDDDLSGRLLKRSTDGTGEKYEHIRMPVIAEQNDILNRKEGELLWPSRFNMENTMATKKAVGSYVWNSQYQCNPTSPNGTIFKRDWFSNMYKTLPSIEKYYISLDCTFKGSENSDYVVMQCWGKSNKNEYYLIDQVRDKMDFVNTVQTFKNFCNKYPQHTIKLVEDKANGSALISTLKTQINGIVGINPKGSKEERAEAITPLLEAKNLYFPGTIYS
jgi:predicted phage terminase large subunit-like protein